MIVKKNFQHSDSMLNYYEIENAHPPLLLIHGEGTDGKNYINFCKTLAKKYHLYAVDCFGHGESPHDPEKYNLISIGDAVIDFISNVIKIPVYLLGFSAGGVAAAYIAAQTDWCRGLFLEDPLLFCDEPEVLEKSFVYHDIAKLSHDFLNRDDKDDFVLYYFAGQYAWAELADGMRPSRRIQLIKTAEKYRRRHPDSDLKVLGWPKKATAALRGLNTYDPRFGAALYDGSFFGDIPHGEMLSRIQCPTLLMTGKSRIDDNGVVGPSISGRTVSRIVGAIDTCDYVHFSRGRCLHIEEPIKFARWILKKLF